jgi:CRP-like cAMP-binding protein
VEPTALCRVRRSDFEELARRNPQVGLSLAPLLAERLFRVSVHQSMYLYGSISSQLLYLRTCLVRLKVRRFRALSRTYR